MYPTEISHKSIMCAQLTKYKEHIFHYFQNSVDLSDDFPE